MAVERDRKNVQERSQGNHCQAGTGSAGSLQCCRIARHGESGFNQGVRNPARIEYSRTASHGVTEYANPTDAANH